MNEYKTKTLEILLQLFFLFLSIVLHECAHGLVALARGDRTAKEEGRLTLNPLPHIDPFGTVILPLLQWFFIGNVFFGYAKPVPVNPFRLKNPRKDMFWVGLAGPLTNLVLGLGSGLLLKFYFKQELALPLFLVHPLMMISVMNFWLMLVNFVPIPPLDGSRMLQSLLPERLIPKWVTSDQLGFFVLFLLIATGFFDKILSPLLNGLIRWVLGLPVG
ncbi:MAG: site-2 protease family protein [Chlamydiae bacterium]|nr:site-2 protease family protein [Chlamydiota bacterium]MBI3267178.1 site-2 protease family protein [Chlamydiota bacterium]